MEPNNKFLSLDLEFWSNVKLLNQKLGYTTRKNKSGDSLFIVPTIQQIIDVFNSEKLDSTKLIDNDQLTPFGQLLIEYYNYRSEVLINLVKPNLLNKDAAKKLFEQTKEKLQPNCPLPINKQKGEKKDYAFFTCMVNMLIESCIGNNNCDFDPRQLCTITVNKFPNRTLSRRVDGAFPSTINPIALWEIKEYYYTTTFGSRVADGVYETQLDGWELWEIKNKLNIDIKHYLFVDDFYTWWTCGRSYLCRLIDSMHMGLVSEVIFGKEIFERIPIIVKNWT